MKMVPKYPSCVIQSKSKGSKQKLHRIRFIHSFSNTNNDLDEKKAAALEDEEGGKSDEEDNGFCGGDALPRDRKSLEEELIRVYELEKQIQNETATDYQLGCAVLLATHEERVSNAKRALERRQTATRQVFEYAREKARDRYRNQCAELQREMDADIERELRRLQTAKDGVSVTSRRRRAVRDETRRGFSTPAKPFGNKMRRRRTMYTSDGDEEGPEDVFLASASPEERALRLQFQEKKRLEQLLGCASVFEPVVKQATVKEIAKDLKTIQTAVSCNDKHMKTQKTKVEKIYKVKLRQKQQHQKHQLKKDQQTVKKPKRQRLMIVTPRRIPHTRSSLPAAATSSNKGTSTATKNQRPRLLYNPQMLQEGQAVEVYKRYSTEAMADNADERWKDECVMSGIITAATATQVYLLTDNGRFESFDVRDCILGSLYVRAVERNISPKQNASRNDMDNRSVWNR